MISLIRADLYRLLNKKSNYLFLLLCSLGFTFIMIVAKFSNIDNEKIFSPALFESALYSSLVIGIIFISTNVLIGVFCDDVSSGYINHIFSVSVNKTNYCIVKFISLCIYVLINYVFFAIVFFVDFLIFSEGFYSDITPYLSIINSGIFMAVISYLSTILYTLLGAFILYTTSKPIEAIIAVLLFSTQMMANLYDLISKVIKPLEYLKPYLYDFILSESMWSSNTSPGKVIIYALIYILALICVNIVFLNTNDLKI